MLVVSVLGGAACAAAADEAAESAVAAASASGGGETHPYQAKLACERAPGSTLIGVMYDLESGQRKKITEISSNGNVGACELAIRASRGRRVCVPKTGGWTIRDLDSSRSTGSYGRLSECTSATLASTLSAEPGYVELISKEEMAPLRAALPSVADPAIDTVLKDARTIFYDESSMVFAYQDSFGSPKGLRANRVGYDVGSTASEPDIRALTEFFRPTKFKFPFAFAAGATFEENVYVLDFWKPPVGHDGRAVPVKIWKNASHWQWVFPVGTVIGEVLFIQAPDDKRWFAFEVRSRTRMVDRWMTGIFRPYVHANDLADAVVEKRPAWASSPDLRALVESVRSSDTLTPFTLEAAPAYSRIFPPLRGALDYLPPVDDSALIKELLTDRRFESAMGERWKTSGDGALSTYAASTRARFHIVPREYTGGVLEPTEAGCRACHEQTSRPLNNLDSRVVLYGEVWGEDEIFTWHPFSIDEQSFSVGDGTRSINRRLLDAGLVVMSSAPVSDATYRALPKPYAARYE